MDKALMEAMQKTDVLLKASNNPFLRQAWDEPLVEFLRQQIVMRLIPAVTGGRPQLPYVCLEHFVLAHGKFYSGSPLDTRYRPGTIKMCYQNSKKAIKKHPELLYVEGYVSSMIPIAHAWNCDPEGNVVDLTLREHFSPLSERAYFGIEFRSDYLRQAVVPLIDDWTNNWPLLMDADLVSEVIVPFEERR